MQEWIAMDCTQYLEGLIAACPIPAKMRTLVGSQMLGQISGLPKAPTAEITSMRSLSWTRFVETTSIIITLKPTYYTFPTGVNEMMLRKVGRLGERFPA